jgi:hypothetical protein
VTDPGPGPEPGDPHSFEDWLAGFTRESSLRPVLVVALGCFTAIGAGALLAAARGHWAALAAVALLALGTVDRLQRDLRQRRLGHASRLALVLWALSALAAVGAVALGIG